MPVSISKIFDIQGSVVAPVSTGVSLDICAFSKSVKLPSSCVMMFTSYEDVLSFFGNSTDPECKYADIYFKGFEGGIKKPAKLLMSRFVDESIAAMMISQKLIGLEDIKSQGEAECDFHISKADGTIEKISVSGLDLSDITSYTGLAQAVEQAINTEAGSSVITVSYNAIGQTLTFTTTQKGDKAIIQPATYPTSGTGADLSLILGVAVPSFLSNGELPRTTTQDIMHVLNCVSDFAGFMFFFTPDSEETLIEACQYLDTLTEDYAIFLNTKNIAATNKGDTTALKALVKDYKNVYVQWGTIENTVLSASIGACVDYDNGTVLNWSFKKQTGLIADVTTDDVYDALLANGYNFYATYGLKAMNDDFLYNGNITGIYNYVDALYNSIWLKDSLQRDLLGLFTSVGTISYTEQGYSLIRSALQNSIDLGLANGVISTGVTLGVQQRIQLEQEFGEDVSSTLESNGYLLVIRDAGSAVRILRGSPECILAYTYGGGINRIVLQSIQIQ